MANPKTRRQPTTSTPTSTPEAEPQTTEPTAPDTAPEAEPTTDGAEPTTEPAPEGEPTEGEDKVLDPAIAAVLEAAQAAAATGSKSEQAQALDTCAGVLADTLETMASRCTAVSKSLRAIPSGDAAQGGVKDLLNRYGDDAILKTAWEQRKAYETAVKNFREKDQRAQKLAQIAAIAASL